MTTHTYRRIDVPVDGGVLRVGIWDPVGEHDAAPSILAVHGITASHLAWPFVVAALPGIRVIAPDLRGRGASRDLEGPAGMRSHANDLAAVVDFLGLDEIAVIGHSMGAFVAVVFAHLHAERVSRLVLIDGGLPLNVPSGITPEQLVPLILGPTAERLSRRWADVDEYVEGFWRHHPAFAAEWSAELEEYIAYDLVADGDALRPATSYQTCVDDTVDMNAGKDLPAALAGLRHPTVFLTVARGLLNETPGLYPPEHLEQILPAFTSITHTALDDLNHYTVVMSARGARALAPYLHAAAHGR